MRVITLFLGFILLALSRPLIKHPVFSCILFGLIFFLVFKLLHYKFPSSKKVIVWAIIISFLVSTSVVIFLFGFGLIEYEYTIPIRVEVRSLSRPQHSLTHNVALVYKGKYDALLRHLIWPAATEISLVADGCLDDSKEYIRGEKYYFRIDNHASCFYRHNWPILEQGGKITIKRGGGEYVRKISFYKPPAEFYSQYQESDCGLGGVQDAKTNEWVFWGTCLGKPVEYQAELREEQYQINVFVPLWGSFYHRHIPLI